MCSSLINWDHDHLFPDQCAKNLAPASVLTGSLLTRSSSRQAARSLAEPVAHQCVKPLGDPRGLEYTICTAVALLAVFTSGQTPQPQAREPRISAHPADQNP